MTESLEDKRIAVLLSGGVDSAVAVHELVAMGCKPDCFYIRIGPEEDDGENGQWDCTAEEDLEMAGAVARKYGLRLEVVDCHREYWEQVTRYTMEKVRAGLTPNPDVMCNRLIKFGAFHEKRGHCYDLIATGHYAQTETDGEGRKWLVTSPDPVKDQTDFLAQLEPWQLRKAIFPIGRYMKDEVREIAEREHLVNARRKDSQGICFLGKINYNDYLRRYLGENPGLVIDIETGKKVGMHRGLWFHTIGQRHGLGFGGGPWFAVKKNLKKNILFVSHGYDPRSAYRQEFRIHGANWLTPALQTDERGIKGSSYPWGEGKAITFKIRHTSDYLRATMTLEDNDTYVIHAEKPIHGVAPGQFCVLYDANHHRCYGSAEITL